MDGGRLLITQRSRVQIPPPLPGKTALRKMIRRPVHGPCDQLCDQQAGKSASLGPSAWAMSPAIIFAAARSWPVDLWV